MSKLRKDEPSWSDDFWTVVAELEFWKKQSREKDIEIRRLSPPPITPIDFQNMRPFVRSSRGTSLVSTLVACAVFGAAALLSGCGLIGRAGKITIPGGGLLSGPTTVKAVADAGSPGTVATEAAESSVKLPAGSVITITRTEAQPATETTPARPAFETREIKPAGDTTWLERANKIAASTGTVDTTVAKHRIDVESRRPLLYIGLALIAAALFSKSLIPAWPSITHGLLVCGGILIGAWKFAEIPWWASLIIAGLIAAKMLGYKRAEWDKDGDGTPDFLQPKSATPVQPVQ